LHDDFKIDGIPVIVDYETTSETLRCGFSENSLEIIKLLKIEVNSSLLTQGMIMYEGEPAADGCGWLISVGTNIYKPIELPTEFKIENKSVILYYKSTQETYRCGFSSIEYDEIEILYIKDLNN